MGRRGVEDPGIKREFRRQEICRSHRVDRGDLENLEGGRLEKVNLAFNKLEKFAFGILDQKNNALGTGCFSQKLRSFKNLGQVSRHEDVLGRDVRLRFATIDDDRARRFALRFQAAAQGLVRSIRHHETELTEKVQEVRTGKRFGVRARGDEFGRSLFEIAFRRDLDKAFLPAFR
ncbi:MAG: hypothetical protein BWY49_00381 [Candidatus Omnitrophica bacterium ADurb.Bin314]|nr:MAG: hypothetical protein BWY49_00381 [Candidatus Omnitrophica bacterium ADurb.Bin314]